MKILTSKSVEKLKTVLKENTDLIDKSLDELINDHTLSYVERYKFDQNIQLLEPTGSSIAESKDKENCILIYKALPDLYPADATDERLWVSLCLSDYKSYFLKRWPDKNNLLIHLFASNWRQRMRDNAIGRLWWTMHLSFNLDKKKPENYLDILLSNSDYRSSLLERSSSANSTVVLKSILEITEEMKNNGVIYERDKFRNFMKEVDFLGKKTLVHSLNSDQIKGLLKPIFQNAYK